MELESSLVTEEIKKKEDYDRLVLPKILEVQKKLGYDDIVIYRFISKILPDILYGDSSITFSLDLHLESKNFRLKRDTHKYFTSEDIPVIKVDKLEDFLQALTEYAITVKHINRMVYKDESLLSNVFLNMNDSDLEDPVAYIKMQTEIYKSQQLRELNEIQTTETIPSIGTKLWIQQLSAGIGYESPVMLESIFSDERPDRLDIAPGTLPVSRFAIVPKNGEKIGFLYSLQDMTKHHGADWLNRDGIDNEIDHFDSGAKKLTNIVKTLLEIDRGYVLKLFGDVPKKVLNQINNPVSFAVSLSEYLSETKLDTVKNYLDSSALQKMGIPLEVQEKAEMNGNTLLFAGYCAERNREIQKVIKRRSFRKKIDRKLLEVVREGYWYETDEAREYLSKVQEIKSRCNHTKSEADKVYTEKTNKKNLVSVSDPDEYIEKQRLEKVKVYIQADEKQAKELSEVEHVENISEISPFALISLLVSLSEMQKVGVRKVEVPVNMPFRWQNHALTSMRTRDVNLEKAINIHHNITEKFVRTVRSLSAHIPGLEITSLPESPEMPLEIKLDPEKWDSDQPILHEIIVALKTRTNNDNN